MSMFPPTFNFLRSRYFCIIKSLSSVYHHHPTKTLHHSRVPDPEFKFPCLSTLATDSSVFHHLIRRVNTSTSVTSESP